jgi:hypothetical protein
MSFYSTYMWESCRTDYVVPEPPALWQVGETTIMTEGIMHLSMGVQKAVFKFVQWWASKFQKGKELQRRLAQLLQSVQDLKLAYVPCRPYKVHRSPLGYNRLPWTESGVLATFVSVDKCTAKVTHFQFRTHVEFYVN